MRAGFHCFSLSPGTWNRKQITVKQLKDRVRGKETLAFPQSDGQTKWVPASIVEMGRSNSSVILAILDHWKYVMSQDPWVVLSAVELLHSRHWFPPVCRSWTLFSQWEANTWGVTALICTLVGHIYYENIWPNIQRHWKISCRGTCFLWVRDMQSLKSCSCPWISPVIQASL